MEVLTPLFYEDPPILLTPTPVSNFVQPSLPLSPNPCHLHPPHQGFFLLSCFFCWMGDHATFDVLFYLMIIWIYTCQALVPWYQKDLNVCFMQQGVRFAEVWHMCFFSGTLDFTNTQTHTAHSGTSRMTHPYKCIYLHHLLCAQSSYLYCIKWLKKWLNE